jgi:hypothetical protein
VKVCLRALSFAIKNVKLKIIQQTDTIEPLMTNPTPLKAVDGPVRLKEYADRWKRLGPLLKVQREDDVRHADIFGSYSFFAGMILKNLHDFQPGPGSGLIEQQSWFRKLHPTSR